jgi:TonB family protein
MHSRDILFIRLLQSVFWPNLLLYFILKELKTVHEFQADAYAAKNEHSYINLLLNDIFSTRQFSMSNTFFCHPLKRRIMMLNKPVSRTKLRMAKSKAVILTALLAGAFVYLQSCKHVENTDATLTQQQKALSDAMKYPDISGDKKIYRFADVMPKPDYDLQAYLAAHIKYPGSARENSIQGRVIVRFVIDEGGNVISPSILRSPDTTLSEEALRVVGNMPKWRPGMLSGANVPVYFTMPIVFALDNGNGHDGLTDELTKEENDTLTGLLEQARTGAISVKDKNRMNELLKKLKK